MSKKLKIAFVMILLCLCLLIAIPLIFIYTTHAKLVHFKGRTELWTYTNEDVFKSLYGDKKIIFMDGATKEEYTYADLGISILFTDTQKEQLKNFYIDIDAMDVYFNYSKTLKEIIRGLNEERNDWKSATFTETETDFVVTDEVIGNKFIIEDVENYIKNNFGAHDLTIDLTKFREPQPDEFITSEKFKQAVKYWDMFHISYSNGFEITKAMIKPYFKLVDDQIQYDESKSSELYNQCLTWTKEELKDYTTLGGTFKFKTQSGEMVEIPGINYGDVYNPYKEAEFLMDMIPRLLPCISTVPAMDIDNSDDIQSNVIEISIEQQHLWRWKDGKLESETDVVTGTKNKHDTPRGVFQILNMIDGVYLEGPGYRSWVDKWMRIYNGYGLHDALWRNKFGGTIYEHSGSHGCINLPHDYAVKLYDDVKPGDIVVIY